MERRPTIGLVLLCCIVFLLGCWLVKPGRYQAVEFRQGLGVYILDTHTGGVTAVYRQNDTDVRYHFKP